MTTQCGNTEVHPAHDACAGLDGTEALDPLTVACPDCYAPAGTGCLFSATADWPPGHVHQERERVVTLRNTERGTCALCGQLMVRTPDGDTWHPVAALLVPCPPLPDPQTQWAAYAQAINTGLEPGRPGPQHFIPAGRRRCPHGHLIEHQPIPGTCGCYDPDLGPDGALPDVAQSGPPVVNQPRPAHSDPMQEPS